LCEVRNCTIRNNGAGIDELLTSTDTALVQNCAVFDNGSTSLNFSGSDWHADSDFNASDTAVADMPGGDTGDNQGELTASDEFLDLTDGSEDYRLKASSNLYSNGATLAAVPNDITGRVRNTPYAIGAHQNPRAGAWIVPAVLGV
jgi:hypothetical protein